MSEQKRTPPKVAVALGYDKAKDEAPRVIATGRGALAESLIKLANQHEIPIHKDHPLANALVKLELGATVPPELYAAVAEVLAFLWRLEQEKAVHGWGEERSL